VAPVYGVAPVRQQVTRGEVTRAPVYKSYVDMSPYYIEAASAGVTGIANTVTAASKYKAATAARPKPAPKPAPKTPGRSP